jgi:phosphotransferase system  glucose/maltose/N-acetylglucosamine-specific IIC component
MTWILWQSLFAEVMTAAEQPLWLRLSPEARVRLLIALVSIVILGMLMYLFIRSFGRWIRYYSNQPSGKAEPLRPARVVNPDDWADRPLRSGGSEDDS